MGSLVLENVKKSYGPVDVIKGVDLDVAEGEFIVFVGPSGCGKSTMLRIIAGLEDQSSGHVKIDGRTVDTVPPAKRGIAMVFQSYALYPHLDVRGNMGLALKQEGMAKPISPPASRRPRHPAAGGIARSASGRTLGRSAPARRHRPRHRARAEPSPLR